MKVFSIITLTTILGGACWGLGFAYGKQYWERRYDWINAELRNDIDGCRSVLNDPHHCVSWAVENMDKICGDCYAE